MVNLISISGKKGSGKNLAAAIMQYYMAKMRGEPLVERMPAIEVIQRLADANHSANGIYREVGGFKQKQFAAKLKQVASILTGIPVIQFENAAFKETLMPVEWNRFVIYDSTYTKRYFASETDAESYMTATTRNHPYAVIGWQQLTYRIFLQLIGTEAFRDVVHPNTWVNALFADYHLNTEHRFITDHNGKVPQIRCIPEKFWNYRTDLKSFCFMAPPNWIITDTRFHNETEAVVSRGGVLLKIVRPGLVSTDEHSSETALDDFHFHHTVQNDGTLSDFIEQIFDFLDRMDTFVDSRLVFANQPII